MAGYIEIKRISSLSLFTMLLWTSTISSSFAASPGELDFQQLCGICHTVGSGKLVGPDLAGVHQRRSQQWLEKFVKSPQTMIANGDADAVALFAEFNQLPMPDPLLSEAQIKDVLSYIEAVSTNPPTPTAAVSQPAVDQPLDTSVEIEEKVPEAPQQATEAQIVRGQELFQGTVRFVNEGPTCNSCHDVQNDAVIGGGILSKELTTVFSRMGGPGVRAILGRPPFPVMQSAYLDRALSEEEIGSLVAFLEYADKEQLNHQPRDYGIGLLSSGLVGTGILFGLCSFVWRGRKKGSVNQTIYDRQVKSISDAEFRVRQS
jgi:mono/diheme cytochrome c family protein